MHDQPSHDGLADALPQDILEHAVLTLMITRDRLSVDELVREMDESADDVLVAVAALAGAGLLHRHDRFVFPTRAAIRFSELGT